MSKGIYEKLIRLMEAVDHIEKRGRNKAQNYDYLMAEDVINEVRQECIKEKLVIIPAATGQEVITSENKSGGTMFLTIVPMTFTICDAETGESIVVPWQGQGQDSGDKGIYKAFTGADKYFLRNLLLIPTGDDPENDGGQPKPRQQKPPTPPAQPQSSIGAPLKPNLLEEAKKVFGSDVVEEKGEPYVKLGDKHPNWSKVNSARAQAIHVALSSLKWNDDQKHAWMREVLGLDHPINETFDIGKDPALYDKLHKAAIERAKQPA